MSTYARLDESGVAVEVITGNPSELFHADLASQFVSVPDTVSVGYKKNGKSWVEPTPVVVPELPAPPKPPLAKAAFLEFLTRAERLALRGARAQDAIVEDFLLMMDETGIADLTSEDGKAALEHFVSEGLLSQERADAASALAA